MLGLILKNNDWCYVTFSRPPDPHDQRYSCSHSLVQGNKSSTTTTFFFISKKASLRLQKCHHAPNVNYTQRLSHWDNDIWVTVWEAWISWKREGNSQRAADSPYYQTDVTRAIAGGGAEKSAPAKVEAISISPTLLSWRELCWFGVWRLSLISAAKNGMRPGCGLRV